MVPCESTKGAAGSTRATRGTGEGGAGFVPLGLAHAFMVGGSTGEDESEGKSSSHPMGGCGCFPVVIVQLLLLKVGTVGETDKSVISEKQTGGSRVSIVPEAQGKVIEGGRTTTVDTWPTPVIGPRLALEDGCPSELRLLEEEL